MLKRNRVIIVAIIAVALAAVGIGAIMEKNKTSNQSLVQVVASYYPLYDFAQNVGGDKVDVTNITPAGSEPHDYDPTPQQLVTTQKATVFIYNGATMEPWVDKFLPTYSHNVVKASNGIQLTDGEPEAGEAAGGPVKDPHFWLDPTLAAQIVDNIKEGLNKASPANTAYFTERATAYKAKLTQLDQDYKNTLSNCQTRTIVTSHDAFTYLGNRYNLDIASIAGLSPEEEPSAAKLAELTDLVRQKNIKYVFFESLVSPKLAETIAAETGAKTATFDPIEGVSDEDQSNGKNYISIQRENLANLKTALNCQ